MLSSPKVHSLSSRPPGLARPILCGFQLLVPQMLFPSPLCCSAGLGGRTLQLSATRFSMNTSRAAHLTDTSTVSCSCSSSASTPIAASIATRSASPAYAESDSSLSLALITLLIVANFDDAAGVYLDAAAAEDVDAIGVDGTGKGGRGEVAPSRLRTGRGVVGRRPEKADPLGPAPTRERASGETPAFTLIFSPPSLGARSEVGESGAKPYGL